MRRRFEWGNLGAVSAISLSILTFACGDNLAPLVDPVYVDAAAASGGNGTQERPFQRFTQGLDAAIPGGLIIVGPGLYEVPSEWTFASNLSVLGSISSPTLFIGDTIEERIRWQSDAEVELFIRDVDFEVALELGGGSVELTAVSVTGIGPALSLREIEAMATELNVSVTQAGEGTFAGDGVVVENTSLTWDKGGALNVADRALVADASELTLSSLALSGSGRGSLHALAASNVEASNLTLENTALAAFVLGSSLSLKDSTVSNTWQPAILVGTGGEATVEDSDFAACSQGFIAASAGSLSLTLERNTFNGSANDNCITAASQSFVAIDNDIDTCASAGILVLDGQDIEVRGNLVQNIEFDKLIGIVASGIELTGATGIVAGNTIKGTLDAGISISNSVLVIDSNTIGPVGGSGISYVDGPSEVTTVRDNVITDATGAGIIALGANVDMSNNEVATTSLSNEGFADGIVFGSGAAVNATGNTLTNNAHSGILFLDGALGMVGGNTATGNLEYGIREVCVGESNMVTVGTNTLTGNTLGEQTLCSP